MRSFRYTLRVERTLAVINRLEEKGVIGRYAIGGAIAATRYIEPIQTYDLDIFVFLPNTSSTGLLSISPVYQALAEMGYQPEAEHMMIEGWAVQFLPAYNDLIVEAIEQAQQVQFGSTLTRVFTAAHLAAIMLDTGRPKDHLRLMQFLEFDVMDKNVFENIIQRFGLKAKWVAFQNRFLSA